MIRWFVCPDGEKIECTKCLAEGGCRMEERCASRPTLKMMYKPHHINPKKIGTTRLLNGTMQAFLMDTVDFEESPQKMAFMIQGTRQHKELEKMGDGISIAEGNYDDKENTIRPDVIEIENGVVTLIDYKTSGSFQVAKAIGMYQVDEPVINKNTGEQAVFKADGKTGKKGDKKFKKAWKQDKLRADVKEWALQLNNYRIGIEKHFRKQENDPKWKVSRIRVEVVVRDGNLASAQSRGVTRTIYMIEIPILPDAEVKKYFARKRKALRQALKQGYWDIPCTQEERWDDDRKCHSYCPVNRSCPYYLEHYMKQSEVESVSKESEEKCQEIE